MNYWCRGTPDVIINSVLSYIFAELPEEKEKKKHLKKKEKKSKKKLWKNSKKKKCAYLNKMFYLTIGWFSSLFYPTVVQSSFPWSVKSKSN